VTLAYITVRGTYRDPDTLTPKVGYIEFRPNVPLSTSYGAILYSSPLQATLDANGFFEVQLLACDNIDVFPYGWYWAVDEKVENGNNWYLMAYTPAGGGRDPLDISNAYRPIGVSDQPPTVVQPGPAGVKGDQGTVSVESTVTGEAGTQAEVLDLDPLASNAYLRFTIPKGEKGDKGDDGVLTGVGLPEIYAEPNIPAPDLTDADVLWVDIDDTSGTGGAGGTYAEVFIQDEPPAATGNHILWVDKNDTSLVPGGGGGGEYLTNENGNFTEDPGGLIVNGTIWTDTMSVDQDLTIGRDVYVNAGRVLAWNFRMNNNSPGTGKVLTSSDNSGSAVWQTPALPPDGTYWKLWTGNQAAYDAIGTKDNNTLYVVV